MHPLFFGFIDSYSLMLALAFVFAFGLLVLYLVKKKTTKVELLNIVICFCGAVIFGLLFAILFQNLYDFIADVRHYHWTWAMTFYGGLFGGILGFLLVYRLFISNTFQKDIKKVFTIAPACITLGHAIGRIGCFLEGCCHGKETSSSFGLYFVALDKTVIPTQLYEMIFLFLLAGILIFLTFRFDFKFNFVVYFISYPIFRFIIEFFRGDERGAFIGIFSPSQIFSFFLLALAIPSYLFLKKVVYKDELTKNH